MKMKEWPLGLLVLLLIGCSAPAPEPAADTAPENTYPDKQTYSAKTPGYLDQNWDHETRLE